MKKTIFPSSFSGTVYAPPSESEMHRLLICAALSDKPSRIVCKSVSDDVVAVAGILNSLCAEVAFKDGYFEITPGKTSEDSAFFDCGESGSALRLMLPVAAASGEKYTFAGSPRLSGGPIVPLLDALKAHGCEVSSEGELPVTVSGKLRGKRISVDGGLSAQFVCGLMLALPAVGGGVLEVTGNFASAPYLRAAAKTMKRFGIGIKEKNRSFEISGSYSSPGVLTAEGDWSAASFWLAAGCISDGGSVSVSGLNPESAQSDRQIVRLLRSAGGNIRENRGSFTAYPSPVRGIEINPADFPNLVPAIAAVASVSEGETVITGSGRRRYREGDRLLSTAAMVTSLGGCAETTDSGLIIRGSERLRGGIVSSFGDCSVAMAAAVLSARCAGYVEIRGSEAIDRSYPGFWENFGLLGGVTR